MRLVQRNLATNVAASTSVVSIRLPSDTLLVSCYWSAWWLSQTNNDLFIAQLWTGVPTAVDQTTNDLASLLSEIRGVNQVGAAYGNAFSSICHQHYIGGVFLPATTQLSLALQTGTGSMTVRAILQLYGDV